MRSQLEKNREILMDEIERSSCEKMNETTAARLSVYRGACKALCLADNEEYGEPVRRQQWCIQPYYLPSERGGEVVKSYGNVQGYLEAYVAWENSVYSRLANINRQLIELGFPSEAELVRGGLPCKELKRVRRMLTEYGLSGWDMAYILQDDKELHDKMKKREK